MPALSYERYGLTGNPFRDLAAENLDDVEMYHVNLQVDDTLRSIKEEVMDKENKALVALAGLHGAGKTERLRLAASEAQQRSVFSVYVDIPDKVEALVPALVKAFQGATKISGFSRALSPPKWYRTISALSSKKGKFEGMAAGQGTGGGVERERSGLPPPQRSPQSEGFPPVERGGQDDVGTLRPDPVRGCW